MLKFVFLWKFEIVCSLFCSSTVCDGMKFKFGFDLFVAESSMLLKLEMNEICACLVSFVVMLFGSVIGKICLRFYCLQGVLVIFRVITFTYIILNTKF